MAVKKGKGLKADERIYKIADRAGRRAFQAFAAAGAALGLALAGLGQIGLVDQTLYIAGLTLCFSASTLLLLYIAFYYYYSGKVLA